jgi:hypothetical protein
MKQKRLGILVLFLGLLFAFSPSACEGDGEDDKQGDGDVPDLCANAECPYPLICNPATGDCVCGHSGEDDFPCDEYEKRLHCDEFGNWLQKGTSVYPTDPCIDGGSCRIEIVEDCYAQNKVCLETETGAQCVEIPDLDGDEDMDKDGDISDYDDSDGDYDAPDGDYDDPDGDATDGDTVYPPTCGFTYERDFVYDPLSSAPPPAPGRENWRRAPFDNRIVHAEPAPEGYWTYALKSVDIDDLVMPDYGDTLPVFVRAGFWTGARCYERPDGTHWLNEEEAFEMYRGIVRATLWTEMKAGEEQRTVIGLRGAYPGTFQWHGNLPNRFNDTIVLLWTENGQRRVREFPVHTDTGPINFGVDSSSSLRPNRRYAYDNGWHRGYNALQINEWNYIVRDDTNNNGHWDSDRNGWLAPFDGEDHDREGSAHNIHMAGASPPLGRAPVNNWSAGCQTIPGMENWTAFITQAWTGEGDAVDYFLLDVRDIAESAWRACPEPEGTRACPYEIRSFPFSHNGDTSTSDERVLDYYNCSTANETGPEVIYALNVRRNGTLTASVSVSDDTRYDPDIHVLDGYDQEACRDRAHISLSHSLPPGRYLLVVDTWVDGSGDVLAGPYQLDVDFN